MKRYNPQIHDREVPISLIIKQETQMYKVSEIQTQMYD